MRCRGTVYFRGWWLERFGRRRRVDAHTDAQTSCLKHAWAGAPHGCTRMQHMVSAGIKGHGIRGHQRAWYPQASKGMQEVCQPLGGSRQHEPHGGTWKPLEGLGSHPNLPMG